MATVMKDSQEGQPERAHLCTKGSYVWAATFGLGSWSVAFTHWKVYGARAINIQLCGKAELSECMEGGRDFVPVLMRDDFLLPAIPRAWLCSDLACVYCIQQPE